AQTTSLNELARQRGHPCRLRQPRLLERAVCVRQHFAVSKWRARTHACREIPSSVYWPSADEKERSRLGPEYSYDWYCSFDVLRPIVEAFWGPPRGQHVLILGCGASTLPADLYDAGYRTVTAIDLSPAAVAHQRRLLLALPFRWRAGGGCGGGVIGGSDGSGGNGSGGNGDGNGRCTSGGVENDRAGGGNDSSGSTNSNSGGDGGGRSSDGGCNRGNVGKNCSSGGTSDDVNGNNGGREGIDLLVADARRLVTLPDRSFDCVVEKGLLDSLLAGFSPDDD
ncbi:unnamed protein product, partial [Phaeothamnion confervicola]